MRCRIHRLTFVSHTAPMATIVRTLALIALCAPSSIHAQDHCSDVEIIALRYDAFGDSALHVVVQYNADDFMLSYPRFHVLDASGDTLAREQMNFFVLAPGISAHRMERVPGSTWPGALFTGTVLFYYNTIDGEQQCTFPITADLCPPTCGAANVYLYAEAGSHTSSTFPWSLADSTGNTIASGALELDIAGWQQDIDSLCLLPGRYTLQVSQPEASGTAFRFGMSEEDIFFNGPEASLAAGGTGELTFDFFAPCISVGQTIQPEQADEWRVSYDGRWATITRGSGRALGHVAVYDATGRCMATAHTSATSSALDLAGMAKGPYLIAVGSAGFTTRILVY